MNISGKQYAPVISLNAQLNSHSILEIQRQTMGQLWRPAAQAEACLPSTGCAHAGGMSSMEKPQRSWTEVRRPHSS